MRGKACAMTPPSAEEGRGADMDEAPRWVRFCHERPRRPGFYWTQRVSDLGPRLRFFNPHNFSEEEIQGWWNTMLPQPPGAVPRAHFKDSP